MIILEAAREVFAHKTYRFVGLVIFLIMFGLLILLPVGRFDAAAFYYQFINLDPLSIASFAFFSSLAALLFSMEIYLIGKRHGSSKKGGVRGFLAFLFSFVSGIFGSGICPICVLVLLNLFGLPVIYVSVLLDYRLPILIGSIAIVLTLLYFTSKTIVAHPEDCIICEKKGL